MQLADALAEARRQLAAHDPAAYASLQAAWRACRCAELAELVERAGRRLPWPDDFATVKLWHAAWVERVRAHDPFALGTLLASLLARSPTARAASLVASCLDELGAPADDPQVTRPLLALLALPAASSAWNKVHTRIFQLLEAAGDPRAIGPLAAAAARALVVTMEQSDSMRASLARAARSQQRLEARFPAGAPGVPADCAEAIAAIRAALDAFAPAADAAPALGDDQALLAAIYDAPDDPARRLVYADLLQARGDPRGELIAVQLAPGRPAQNRAATLVAKHRRALLGPLAKAVVASTAVFEGGFLAACETDVRRLVEAGVVFGRPEWATVKRLTFRGHAALTPAMRNLVEVHGVPTTALAALAKVALPSLEVLGLDNTHYSFDNLAHGADTPPLRAFAATTGLPRLRELILSFSRPPSPSTWDRDEIEHAWILAAPFGPQLERVRIGFWTMSLVPAWLAILQRTKTLREVVLHAEVLTLVLARVGRAITATATRAPAPGDRAAAAGRQLLAAIQALLGAVPLVVT